MNSLNRTRTPLGSSFTSNVPRSSPVLGRNKAFEGVIKAVTARKASVSFKIRPGEQNDPTKNAPVRSATHARQKSNEAHAPLSTVLEQQEVEIEHFDLNPFEFTADHGQPILKQVVQDSAPSKIIYSTSSSFSSTSTSSTPSSDVSSLRNISLIPSSGLSEEEERQVVGSGTFFGDEDKEVFAFEETQHRSIRLAAPIPAPVFLSEPSKSELKIENLVKPTGEEVTEQSSTAVRTVRRKPVPTESLASASREALLSKIAATRPVTSSLLSFTEDTPAVDRRRHHPERIYRTRNVTPSSDILRKSCVERGRLYRAGLLFTPLPSTPSSAPKYYLYPRAGDLATLHSDESTSVAEDFYLSYVDLSFIRKTLFAFDMRMRAGRELWGNEMEEIYRFFGRKREWEKEWDIKWRVAAWLLHQVDEEVEGTDAEEQAEA